MRCFSVFLFTILFTSTIFSQDIFLDLVVENLNLPLDMNFDSDNNMYVVEKAGRIIKIDNNGIKSIILDITNRVNSNASERGLLGMAFDPAYDTNGYLYVHYSGSNGESIVSRFTKDNMEVIDPSSEEIILEIAQPFKNHNGGTIKFGPDGYLYIGMGDGGSAGDPDNNAQNPQLLLGKMLRIDVSQIPYLIPADNPFVGDILVKDEIWATGLRNPWKFTFDRENGDLYIADVGQNDWEEVDFVSSSSNGGENYGWKCYEGFEEFDLNGCGLITDYTMPVYTYSNNEVLDGCSITGGYVYRGSNIPDFKGKYIYGDFCSGKIWTLFDDGTGNWINEEIIEIDEDELASFGQDNEGEIYVIAIVEGSIYKLESNISSNANVDVFNELDVITLSQRGKYLIKTKFHQDAIGVLSVISLNGVTISQNHIGLGDLDDYLIDLTNEPQGLYFVTVEIEGERWTKKLVK